MKWLNLELDIVIWQEKLCKNMQFFHFKTRQITMCIEISRDFLIWQKYTAFFISIEDLFF